MLSIEAQKDVDRVIQECMPWATRRSVLHSPTCQYQVPDPSGSGDHLDGTVDCGELAVAIWNWEDIESGDFYVCEEHDLSVRSMIS